jgi:hypothetical protein
MTAFAAPLQAQAVGAHPATERGKHSIALEVDGGPQIGYWSRRSERTDLGLDVGVSGLWSDGSDQIAVALTPAIKHYLRPTGALAPYTYWGIPLTYMRTSNDNVGVPDTSHDRWGAGGLVGFGLDWFPISQVSIGGHVGFRIDYTDLPDDDQYLRIGTASSGIRVHLYF